MSAHFRLAVWGRSSPETTPHSSWLECPFHRSLRDKWSKAGVTQIQSNRMYRKSAAAGYSCHFSQGQRDGDNTAHVRGGRVGKCHGSRYLGIAGRRFGTQIRPSFVPQPEIRRGCPIGRSVFRPVHERLWCPEIDEGVRRVCRSPSAHLITMDDHSAVADCPVHPPQACHSNTARGR